MPYVLNASDSGEKQHILRESRLVRLRETIQELRGGNFLLSGTVPPWSNPVKGKDMPSLKYLIVAFLYNGGKPSNGHIT